MTPLALTAAAAPPAFSLAGTIDHVAPRLPPALVAPGALARVRALADSFPASLTSWIDLECRLRDGCPQVDVSLRIDRRGRGELARVSRACFEASGRAAWRRVAAFARAWADRDGPASHDVAAAWLEFDLDAGCAAPLPRLFIDLDRRVRTPADRFSTLRAVTHALEPMVGHPLPRWLCGSVGRCLVGLPPATELLYVGLPADERVTRVRLCLLDRRERRPGILHVDLDDRGRIGWRLGREYPFRRRPQVRGVVAETTFLDGLVARGLCAADKRDAMLAWPGCGTIVLPHALWPSLELRRISHVKVVFDRATPPEAKAYLCLAHEWRPDLARTARRPSLLPPPPIAS